MVAGKVYSLSSSSSSSFAILEEASELSTRVSAPLFVDAPSLIIDNGPTPYSTSTEHSRDNFSKGSLLATALSSHKLDSSDTDEKDDDVVGSPTTPV